MAHDPASLTPEMLAFLAERHLATLTTLRGDGSPHVVPVGFGFDPDALLVRIITPGGGGWGHPADRPAEDVLADVLDGFVSEAAALEPASAPSSSRRRATQAT